MMFADYPLHVFTNKELKFSWYGFGKRAASTVFVRIVVFDPIHNNMIGEDYNYIGNTNPIDKIWRAVSNNNDHVQEGGWFAVRIVSVGMLIPLNYK